MSGQQSFHFDRILLPEGWTTDVAITVRDGLVAAVEPGVAPVAGVERHAIALPGLPNLHSHAFQRGMAGLAEVNLGGDDSFWSWRETMYRFVARLTPDHLRAIAAQAYVEMLETGFTRVGEFHYLHHDIDGGAFADPAAMSLAIVEAAAETGIALTHLPVFYAHAGFGGLAPGEGQRRFVHDVDGYARLIDRLRAPLAALPDAVLGVAPHSLRAVTPDELAAVATLGDGPVHIHIAEQVKEVEDCLAWSGARPVEWLLDHAPVDARWCLVHATHMTDEE
ncbi:formimidoylglutamate deiminase, partial [Rhizorhabdus wittichii]|uniref:formimidoylglutamate deiminase n=1 Tax=Rhizorhabdus wittichii TaxID=160791 RepID=UPI000381C57B